MKIYETTYGDTERFDGEYTTPPASPIPPDDHNEWEFKGSAANRRTIYWFWEREIAE